jgi:DegV family protein with EDD domain
VEPTKVIVDSGADLPPDVVSELGIDVISQVVTLGREVYDDTAVTPDAFWELAKRGHPGTSQPPTGVFQTAFARCVEQGFRVLCLTITGRHSGTYNSACIAAQGLGDRVTVFDTLSLSLGQGFQALVAARMARLHVPVESIVTALQSLRERTHVVILLDSLESLRRGGRADKLMPAFDRLMHTLNLKPLINIVEGELKLLGVARSYQKGLERLKQEMGRIEPLEHLAVVHTRRPEVASRLADELAALLGFPRNEILVREATAVLSSHAGAGVAAVCGVRKG